MCECVFAPVGEREQACICSAQSPRLIGALSWSLMGCGENSPTSSLSVKCDSGRQPMFANGR